MNIDLSDEQFRLMVHKSLFESLTPEKRDELVRKGIEAVLRVEHGSYDKKSELQRQFEYAVSAAAKDIVSKELAKDDGFMTKLRSVVMDAMFRVFDDKAREKLVDSVANAITSSLWKDRY